MTTILERKPTKPAYHNNPSTIIEDGSRVAAKHLRVYGYPIGQRPAPKIEVAETSFEAESEHDSEASVIDLHDTFPFVEGHSQPIEQTRLLGRIGLGARLLSGSIIERLSSPAYAPQHRGSKLGQLGLRMFRTTGGAHKRIIGKHKAVRTPGGKHRA